MSEWNRGFTNNPEDGNLCIPTEENDKNETKVGVPNGDTVLLYKDKLVFNEKENNSHQPIK